MATYSVTVNIDQAHVLQFNTQGYKLCFAAGVASSDGGDPAYNVVAFTKKVGSHVKITWTEKYGIAASDSTFNGGVQFNVATNIIPITFGQSYVQPAEFTDGTCNSDPKAPKSGFNFINQASSAAAVVYKKVNGEWAPIYISAKAPLSPGTERLVPKVTCAIWFSAEADTANMLSNFDTTPITVDLTQNQSHAATVDYNKDGAWTVLSNS